MLFLARAGPSHLRRPDPFMANPATPTPAVDMARLPPVRAIQAFEAIARLGSVAAAADELGVSSGAISQQLRKIGTELDAKLFKRAGRSLTLTSWGRLYCEEVRSAYDDLRRAQQRLQAARERKGIAI